MHNDEDEDECTLRRLFVMDVMVGTTVIEECTVGCSCRGVAAASNRL